MTKLQTVWIGFLSGAVLASAAVIFPLSTLLLFAVLIGVKSGLSLLASKEKQ
jgi:hypothetical protein